MQTKQIGFINPRQLQQRNFSCFSFYKHRTRFSIKSDIFIILLYLPHTPIDIFERFYRGEDPLVLATPGNGLGLSITKQLVEMHHGRIWMESDGVPGAGSVFHVAFPLAETDQTAETQDDDADILY